MIIFKVLIDALVGLLFAIDNVIYGFIPILYRLLLYLSNVDLVTGNVPVQALIQRVYILVGVFMLFRLSFSILNYIINPDAFSDQSKGFSNLVKRVLIAIVLLVGIPWIFKEGYVIQNKIITSGVLPRLILGESIEYSENAGNEELEDAIETSAKDVQFMLFGPFFSINYEEKGDGEDTGELEVCRPTSEYPTSNILGTNGMAANEACMKKIANLMDESTEVQSSGAYLSDFFRYEETSGEIVDKRRFDNFGGLLPLTLENGNRVIKYYFIASTLCGGYLVFLLLSFCIDVAARVIRLFFLQILSPIAVISSIDPTSTGDRLKDWAKECVKVWASLFLRLLVIFLIIQLVRVISNSVYSGSIFSTGYSNSSALNAWIYVFLILGVFQAAKSIPDFIEKATGIKMSGDLQLNPFKALGENTILQKGLGVATGVGIGAIGAATGAGIGRIFSGAYQGLKSKNAMEVQKGMVEGNRRLRNARSDGSTFGGRMEAWATNLLGSQGALGKVEDEKVKLENDKTRIENEIQPVRDAIQVESEILSAINEAKSRAITKAKQTNAEYIRRIAEADAMEQAGKQSNNAALIAQAQTMRNAAEKDAATVYAQEWFNNNQDDADIQVAMGKYRRAIQTANRDGSAIQGTFSEQTSANGIWNQENDLKINSNDLSLSIVEREDEIKAIDKQIEKNDMDHRRVESNYKAVGGQSGGTREKNATTRPDAGQHFGSTNFFGPMGPPPGGPGHRP